MQVMTISAFLNRDYELETNIRRIAQHLKKHRIKYQIIGLTLIIFATGGLDGSVFAASSGIDAGASKIYHKLLSIGKWVIVVKGAFDTLQNTLQGDFASARKAFLQYLMVYVLLLAFPFAMDEVDKLFAEF